ncbi:MAG: hypothetical protein KGY50_02190, partial [Candidatus Thermoplasmatota archaeon]|nr:hypothetical protein [Candidatus Thermoplasmatota archaeon]
MHKSDWKTDSKNKFHFVKKDNISVWAAIGIIILLISILFILSLTIDDDTKEILDSKPTIPTTQLLTKTYNQMEQGSLIDQIEIADDRIAPYENQGVILEVLRIRHRGLLDRLLTQGNDWKKKPEFYFITNMDGMEYVSKDVEQHGQVTEVLFNTWDSMFQENKVMRTAH